MQVKSVIETPEGMMEVEATLGVKEVQFVLEVGLNYLMREGSIPFTYNTAENIHQEPEEMQ